MSTFPTISDLKSKQWNEVQSCAALTALAALLAVGMAAVVTAAPAVAQEKKPNILFIMGDDIGLMQVAPIIKVGRLGKHRTSTALRMRAASSPTTMRCRAARRGGTSSSPACTHCARV